jgi:hypothetical protein
MSMIGYRMTVNILLILLAVPSIALDEQTAEQGAVAAARDIVRGVEEKRPDPILAHVARGGIPCVDSVVTREHVEKDLKTRGSWYHAYFFGPTDFNERFRDAAYPTSLAELVTKGGELSYRVRFQQYPKLPPFNFPCVSITSRQIKGKEGLCFFHEHGKWWLRDGPNCD